MSLWRWKKLSAISHQLSGRALSSQLIIWLMTVVLKNRHWALVCALSLIQLVGLWLSLSRSPYGPAVVDFFRRGGWLGLIVPASIVFSSAFTTTVVLAELTKVFTKRKG